jgi:hypothetical protein
MATVKVEDARSNVAGWLHFLGVDQVPALLASANTDWIALVSAFFSSLGALAYTTHVAREALDGVEYIGPGSSYLKRTKIQEPKEVPGGERHKDQNDGFH